MIEKKLLLVFGLLVLAASRSVISKSFTLELEGPIKIEVMTSSDDSHGGDSHGGNNHNNISTPNSCSMFFVSGEKGLDYKDIKNKATAGSCKLECDVDDKCNFFSYYKEKKECFLFEITLDDYKKQCAYAGVPIDAKDCDNAAENPCKGYSHERCTIGGQIELRKDIPSEDICKRLCTGTELCKIYSYATNKDCTLYGETNDGLVCQGFIGDKSQTIKYDDPPLDCM